MVSYVIIGIAVLVVIAIVVVAVVTVQNKNREVEEAKVQATIAKLEASKPINGGWSDWVKNNPTFKCKKCSDSFKETRKCDNPFPSNGGAQCDGEDTRMTYCDDKCVFKKLGNVKLDYQQQGDYVVANGLLFKQQKDTNGNVLNMLPVSKAKKSIDRIADYKKACKEQAGCEILVIPDDAKSAWYSKYDGAFEHDKQDKGYTSYFKRSILDKTY
jgi:hypothetical protein